MKNSQYTQVLKTLELQDTVELTLNQAERLEELEILLASNSDCDDFLDYCEEYDTIISSVELSDSFNH